MPLLATAQTNAARRVSAYIEHRRNVALAAYGETYRNRGDVPAALARVHFYFNAGALLLAPRRWPKRILPQDVPQDVPGMAPLALSAPVTPVQDVDALLNAALDTLLS